MSMGDAAFRVLPVELTTDPAATTVVAIEHETSVLVVAGPGAQGQTTISAVSESWVETLWSLSAAQQRSAGGRADLAALDNGQVLALVPKEALLLLDPLADDEAKRAQKLKPGRARLPDRLFSTRNGATGLWLRSDGKTLLATVGTSGAREKDSERAGPSLQPGQAVNLVLRDTAGRDVVVVEDHRTGFQIWRQEGSDTWAHLTSNGAARFGLNSAVVTGLLWGDRVVLATGNTEAVKQALPGMPISAELIALEPDGQLHLLAGEIRTASTGLMVPALSASSILKMDPESYTHLALDDAGRLVLAVGRRNGSTGLFAIAPDLTVTALADPCDLILGLVRDQAAPGLIGAVVSQ